MPTIELGASQKQFDFMNATQDEVLYGGAAGGGKSFAQVLDAMIFANKYPGSSQVILRRTMPQIKQSILPICYKLFPKEIFSYNITDKVWTHKENGSLIYMGYMDSDEDKLQYDGAEFDVVRFDELTHFLESQYVYMLSRIRGSNGYPKQVKSSTNPGKRGHTWVKNRFITGHPPNKQFKITDEDGYTSTYIFIPALVTDNKALTKSNPEYIKNLNKLPDKERKALRDGDWDILEGRFFSEFDTSIHVIKPFEIPSGWRHYITLDYGQDMLAAYWIAVDYYGMAYVYKELYKSKLLASAAAKEIRQRIDGGIYMQAVYAPPDLWNTSSHSGTSTAQILYNAGLMVVKSDNQRVHGWRCMREWLQPFQDKDGKDISRLRIFNNCENLINSISNIEHDDKKPDDVAKDPHDLTHAPDAIRYWCVQRPLSAKIPESRIEDTFGVLKHDTEAKDCNPYATGEITQDYMIGGWDN